MNSVNKDLSKKRIYPKLAIALIFAIVIMVGLRFIGSECGIFGKFSECAKSNNTVRSAQRSQSKTAEVATEGGGKYEEYSPDLVGSEDITVLFFYASWCPSCTELKKNLQGDVENGNIPTNMIILEVDYDKNKELRKKYDIVTQHTLVWIDKDGTEIKKWIGGDTLDTILRQLD